jgi:hypothetical protein
MELFFGVSLLLLVGCACLWVVEQTDKQYKKSNELKTPPLPIGTKAYFYQGNDKIEGTIIGFKDNYYTLHVTKLLGMEHIIDVDVYHKHIKV